ncbi:MULTISPECIES: PucR family transcriptional regulator [unclassified Streptomyces]|uniref:PucR family transcriptional regulator n=1 Tax=unclassified Streptomyces TaxID=2593676 RepID=UPI002E7678ED|nr:MULTISPECIES: helix-turn-helix domain-containing protein [unclassified Streptomyces]MEE1759832.1 helix-turn-helix domain-containing protein [Streptomyces sp. SP18BB07]MEE1829645.1 helix-turn-helix domain-containing protein [Streptomyces sp. SP17KL33]
MDISGVAAALHSRLPELGERIAGRIRSDVDAYADESLIPFDSLRRSCTANADLILNHLRAGATGDPSPARETGRVRAVQGVPLADTLHAYRVGFELLWTEIVAESRTHPEVSADQLVAKSAEIWALFGLYAEAVAAAYRETAAELTSRGQARRSALVEALFTGVIADRTTLWEAARELGLPERGPYTVVAAAAGAPGEEPLAGVEAGLRQAQLPSAWRLLPDQQLGLIALPTAAAEDTCLGVLRRTRARVGVSPSFDSLRDTPQALRFARLALAGLRGDGPGVARFDDDPLAMVVAAAPAEAAHLVDVVLRPVVDLPVVERARLLRTLEHWFAAAGSATAAARSLFVHPNTVRYRLRRVEELTARSLSDPRAVAHIGTALLAVRDPGAGHREQPLTEPS